jgi:hypothetical protein
MWLGYIMWAPFYTFSDSHDSFELPNGGNTDGKSGVTSFSVSPHEETGKRVGPAKFGCAPSTNSSINCTAEHCCKHSDSRKCLLEEEHDEFKRLVMPHFSLKAA